MGAVTFKQLSHGKTPLDAFRWAQYEARDRHGDGGYTGTIAEKEGFVNIPAKNNEDPFQLANSLLENGDARVNDKWGPCGCLKVTGSTYAHMYNEEVSTSKDESMNVYLFFGWASS